MTEVWRDIEGYEGLYQVSNLGNVRSLNWGNQGYTRNMYLKKHPSGYRQVELVKNGIKKMITVHRLVAMAFVPNPDGLPMINHRDEDKTNNRVENLEWCDNTYNVLYSLKRHASNTKYRDRKIVQKDRLGNVLRVWENVATVKRVLGYNAWSITQCCNGKRSQAYGFEWQFAI